MIFYVVNEFNNCSKSIFGYFHSNNVKVIYKNARFESHYQRIAAIFIIRNLKARYIY